MNATLTPRALDVIAASDEYSAPIFRTPCSVGSGEVALVERLKREAQFHAQEARTANSTIAEIYRVVSGGTGEPGNWHGAEPVRKCIEELRAAIAAATEGAES